ncbi:ATP synthase subunit 6 (mitochondrion) [Komagataella phaffii]|uniref:ATP synthase subunit 6 n=1 Tax=Komagataella phaffii (strain ATCC 76273 / CBS 7435 / CECT 11047 / NRRL Y-11430 / Wegner 21-1) TaxID=981350 RepID=UPI00020490F2|nr:ATP synthase subunit 6 [Komagataella phaffii CBS 7435]
MFIFSPLDQFDMKLFIGFASPIDFISNLNITTFTIYTILVYLVIYYIFKLSLNNKKIIGSQWFLSIEATFHTILNMVKGQIGGTAYGTYVPFIYTLFIFILIANLIGMIPYSFALSACLVFIISLSIIIWIGVTILGLVKHGFVFFSLFVPGGTPLPLVPVLVLIELLSYTARAVSLGLRLSANTLAGHLLLNILSSLIFTFMSISYLTFGIGILPLFGVFAIVGLEWVIGMIQAYVFSILTSSYIKDAVYLH